MSNLLHPLSIQKIGGELAIAWSDTSESYIALEALRRACPCARTRCSSAEDAVRRGLAMAAKAIWNL